MEEKIESYLMKFGTWFEEGPNSGLKPDEMPLDYWQRGQKMSSEFLAEFRPDTIRYEKNLELRETMEYAAEAAYTMYSVCVHELMHRKAVH